MCALLALSQAVRWGWASGYVLCLFAAAALIGVLWVVVEERAASPLIDMCMMRTPHESGFTAGYAMLAIAIAYDAAADRRSWRVLVGFLDEKISVAGR